MQLVIQPDGTVRCVYGETVDLHASAGWRSSEAPTWSRLTMARWQADLSPVGGPVLGPFRIAAMHVGGEGLAGTGVAERPSCYIQRGRNAMTDPVTAISPLPRRPLPVTIVPGMLVYEVTDIPSGEIVAITQAYCLYQHADSEQAVRRQLAGSGWAMFVPLIRYCRLTSTKTTNEMPAPRRSANYWHSNNSLS